MRSAPHMCHAEGKGVKALPGAVPVSPLPTDNTAGVYARRGGFSRQKQDLYLLPIVISDGGIPPMSSTNALTIRVCGCDVNGALLSCNAEAYILNAGLSTGALIAILACIVILLGKGPPGTCGPGLTARSQPGNKDISRAQAGTQNYVYTACTVCEERDDLMQFGGGGGVGGSLLS